MCNDYLMTGEAHAKTPLLWLVIGFSNHLKSHTQGKHSRLKGSQLVLIYLIFSRRQATTSPLSSHILFHVLSTSGLLTRSRHLQAMALCPDTPPVPKLLAFSSRGLKRENVRIRNWAVLFKKEKKSQRPPETLRKEGRDGLVEEKEESMKCWQLCCLAVKKGNFFSSLPWWAMSVFLNIFLYWLWVFF